MEDLFRHLIITLRETFIGYFAGTLGGILVGALLARMEFLGKVLDPFILAYLKSEEAAAAWEGDAA